MKLAELMKGIPLGDGVASLEVSGIAENSRQILPGMLFVALKGTRADGMAFARQAVSQGAAAILAGFDAPDEDFGVPVIRVVDPRRVLAKAAAAFYGRQPKVVAGVTGTNGKTSVASFARQIWTSVGHDAASLGTVGVVTSRGEQPLHHTTPDAITLHQILAGLERSGVTHLAVEASSHGLDQRRLDGVIFAATAFTNISRDHLDYHATFEDYLDAKLRLFRELAPKGSPAIIDADAPGGTEAAEAARRAGLDVRSVGREGGAITLREVEQVGFRQRLTLSCGGRDLRVELPLSGDFQVSNALVAAGIAIATGCHDVAAITALAALRGAKGRLEFVGETASGAPVFIDYAHTPDALAKALGALRPYAARRLHVVFGCGGDRDAGKRPQMGLIAAQNADIVTVTDDNPRSEEPALIRRAILAAAPGAREIANRAEAIATAIGELEKGDVLLIAGKGHETGQTIGTLTLPFSDHEEVARVLALSGHDKRGKVAHG